MKTFAWLLVATCLALFACQGKPRPPSATASALPDRTTSQSPGADPQVFDKMVTRAAPTDDFVEGLPFFGFHQLLELRALGTVVREKVRRSPNPHVPGTETEYRTLEFDSLVLDGFVKTGEGGGFATCRAVVSGGAWLLPKGLRVGVEEAEVTRALGEAAVAEGNTRTYGGFRTQTQVDFKVEAGRVSEIVVTPWCD